MTPPRPSSALPPEAFHEAVPKGISGRASYLQVCLAFHSVPRVIATFFNRLPFGPPRGVTPVSACPRQDHLGFGSAARDLAPVSDSLSLRLRDSDPLASRPIPRLAGLFYKRHAATLSRRGILKARGFRFSFTPLAGVLFTFPSRYYALSVAVRIQPWIVVDPDSGRVPRAPPYSGTASWRRLHFAYGTVTLFGAAVRPLLL